MIEPLELVRERLREHDCRPGDGDRFNCRCPAHDDRSPSLSVGVGADGQVLLCCQAGCELDDVLAKLGLEVRDLFASRNGDGNGRRIAETYDYEDEGGALLYQVVRFDPKDFRQRRPGTNGEAWVWNLRGVRRVLYRLPQVRAAIDADEPVWLTAGEKDVHSLAAQGVVATTAPMGEGKGKWRDEYSEMLRGAHVVIVGDSDKLGQEHVRLVAGSLEGKAASITLKRCPAPHKDVTDWLGSGGTLDGLEPLAAEGEADDGERKSVVTLASDVRSRRVRWAWKGYMPLGYLTIQTGESKLGKSTFFCHTAAQLGRGRLAGEHFGKSARVLTSPLRTPARICGSRGFRPQAPTPAWWRSSTCRTRGMCGTASRSLPTRWTSIRPSSSSAMRWWSICRKRTGRRTRTAPPSCVARSARSRTFAASGTLPVSSRPTRPSCVAEAGRTPLPGRPHSPKCRVRA